MSYLGGQIRAVVKIDPARAAFISRDGERTWADVDHAMSALNAKLDELGLPEATPIGCLLRNKLPHVSAVLGVLAGERCVLTLNPALGEAKLKADIIAQNPPVIVAAEEDWGREAVREGVKEIGAAAIVLTNDPRNPVRFAEGFKKIGDTRHREAMPDVAVLMLTSGTTGEPKRAALGYRQLEMQMKRAKRADRSWREDDPPKLTEDVALAHAPLVHIGGVWGLLFGGIGGGRTSYLMDKFTVQEWRDAVVRFRPAAVGGPPTVLRMIYDANLPKEDLASIKTMGSGTAAVSPDLVDAFMERYGIPVLSTYGATEFAGAVAGWSLSAFQKYWKDKRGAAGRMNPGCEARAVDPDTGEELPFGAKGILELRAPTVGDGENWVRTSDLASVDEDNFLFIHGRADNAINRGGFKISPDEIVKTLETHPAIREASVVGVPDARLGAVPAAAYIVRDGQIAPAEADIVAFLRERLAPYQVPVKFRAVEELPRTPSLKVSTPAVRALFGVEP